MIIKQLCNHYLYLYISPVNWLASGVTSLNWKLPPFIQLGKGTLLQMGPPTPKLESYAIKCWIGNFWVSWWQIIPNMETKNIWVFKQWLTSLGMLWLHDWIKYYMDKFDWENRYFFIVWGRLENYLFVSKC
jgi:hypothetical protein